MSVKFIQGTVQSSDNKYTQYRLMAQSFTTDVTQWTIDYCGVYTEDFEFVRVYTDCNRKILWAIKSDGDIYFGAGVPTQVKDYIQSKIQELSLDEYTDIVTFLGSLIEGETLATLLNGKVDKVTGKSLINTEYATGINYVEDQEFAVVFLDSDKKILFGIKNDGDTYFGYGVPTQIVDYVSSRIAEITASLATKVDKETGKSLIQNEVAESIFFTEDAEGKSEVKIDKKQRLISYRDSNGILHECVGFETKQIKTEEVQTDNLLLSEQGMENLQIALINSGFKPGGAGNWSDYLSNDGEKPLVIPMPKLAIVNLITDYDLTQLSKAGKLNNPPYWPAGVEGVTYDIPIEVEFWDMQGNYFKKKAYIGGQGDSTMYSAKKNIGIDLFDSDWGEDAFSVRFGNWVPQDSFHIKAYSYEPFVGASAWAYKLNESIHKTQGFEIDHVWKKALLNLTDNSSIEAYGTNLSESLLYEDTGARCYPDGFPVIVYQTQTDGEGMVTNFWGVFSWQLKKHRDNYHMEKNIPENIHLDGTLGSGFWTANGDATQISWNEFEIRNPKKLVYAQVHSTKWEYDADLAQAEIAGNSDGSTEYDTWSAGSYAVNKIVEHQGHLFINTVADNTQEPIYHSKNNADDSPDFKNKTGCGWLNCTNTVKVKEYILEITKIMTLVNAKKVIYEASPTPENLAALKATFESVFDVDNLINYIIITDITKDGDGFNKNWQWTTYDGVRWWCNLYDCNISFGYTGEKSNTFSPPLTNTHVPQSYTYMMQYIYDYYSNELNEKWAALRDSKVISLENIFNIIEEWVSSIGTVYFDMENKKWETLKSKDNEYRLYKWIKENLEGLDNVYEYNQ